MTLLHISSGAAFAIAWFIFIDGAVMASRGGADTTYRFVEYLPGILNLAAMVLLGFVNPAAFQQGGGETDFMMGGGGDDQRQHMAARSVFFMAVCVSLAGFSIAVWMLSTRYSTAADSWPGIALTLQCCGLMGSGGLPLAARSANKREEETF